jgi:serine/threonine-protein kinase
LTRVAGTGDGGFSGDGGPPTSARFALGYQIEIRGSWLYVTDSYNGRIRRFKL